MTVVPGSATEEIFRDKRSTSTSFIQGINNMSAEASSSSAPKKGKKSRSTVNDAAAPDAEEVPKNKRHRKEKRTSCSNTHGAPGLELMLQRGTQTT